MTGIVAVIVTTWAVLALCGLAVLAAVPPGRVRDALVPAAPALGAGALVVALHWTTLLLPTSVGWFVALAAVAAAGAAHRRRWRVPARPVRVLALSTLAGALPLCVVVAPLVSEGRPTVVQPSPNNDAFSYVTVAEWLQEHRARDVPTTARDGPAFGYAEDHLRIGLRIGEELVVAGVATTLGSDPLRTWYPAMAVWFLVLPGAAAAALSLLGHRPLVGLIGGLAAAGGAVAVGMAYNQSSASLLGVAMAPLVLALVHARVTGDEDVPLWLSAGAAAALVGTYTELVPLALPAVAVAAAAAPGSRRAAAARLAAVAAAAVVMAPLVAWNAARSLSTTATLTTGRPSMFLDVPAWAALHRFLGLAGPTAGERPSAAGVVVALALVVAVGAALVRSRGRALWLGVVVASVALVAYLSAVHAYPYGQERAVSVSQPLWILGAAAGLDVLGARLRHLPAAARLAAVATAVTAVVLYAAGNVRTVDALDARRWASTRSVGPEFDEAAAWVARYGGPDGSAVLVLVSNFFDQLWLLYATRDAPSTSFGFVHRDYASVEPYSLWDGRLPRYVVVGRDEFRSVPPEAVVASNERFTLVDTTAGPMVVAVPGERIHFGEPGPSGVAHWAGDRGELLVVRSPTAPAAVELTAQALADLAPLPVTVRTGAGELLASLVLPASPSRQRIVLPDRAAVLLVLDNAKRARRPAAVPEFRDLSVYLSAVRPG